MRPSPRSRSPRLAPLAALALLACAAPGDDATTADTDPPAPTVDTPAEDPPTDDTPTDDTPADDTPPAQPGDTDVADDTAAPNPPVDPTAALNGDPFADAVVAFTPGLGAGFGQTGLPGVVLGPPLGAGPLAGSLDVVSLGDHGEIVLAFLDQIAVDGDGPDLIVFENPFPGWIEPGEVAVSEDGVTWAVFPCDPRAPGAPGCAGVQPVLSNPANGISPTDPAVAGGDAFDLATVGLTRAAFVRIRDTGAASAWGNSAGFDLDAVAIVHAGPP